MKYYVFPSWADLGIKWDDLKQVFDDSVNHGQMDINTVNWLKSIGRYPLTMPPYQLVRGPAGGGIVITDEMDCEQPPAVFHLLSRIAGSRRPDGLPIGGADNIPSVTVLEARGDLHLILGRKIAAPHYCSIGLEHVDAASGDVFWVIEHSASGSNEIPVDLLADWARTFGFGVTPMVPAARMTDETKHWGSEVRSQRTWLHIKSDSTSAGLHLAVVVYVAYAMKKRLGRKLHSMTLVSHIEGQPRWRSAWH